MHLHVTKTLLNPITPNGLLGTKHWQKPKPYVPILPRHIYFLRVLHELHLTKHDNWVFRLPILGPLTHKWVCAISCSTAQVTQECKVRVNKVCARFDNKYDHVNVLHICTKGWSIKDTSLSTAGMPCRMHCL